MAGKKQLPQLLESTILIRGIDVRDADELAFMARMLGAFGEMRRMSVIANGTLQ